MECQDSEPHCSNSPTTPEKQDHDADDGDEEIGQQMTASYSEISVRSEQSLPLTVDYSTENLNQRPITLSCGRSGLPMKGFRPLNSEGTVHVEGNMTHFVAEDLEYKIKLSSPVSKKGDANSIASNSRSCTPSSLYRQLLVPQVGPIDVVLLSDLENEAQRIATSIDNLTENLCGILHSISSITADNVDIYKNAVSKMSDAMDANIKSMYTIMAKSEEVSDTMKSVQSHANRIREVKRLVDLFESYI